MAALLAALSLATAGLTAAAVVPDLARNSLLSRWSFRTRYQLTREGFVYLLIILLISVAALNTGNNLLFMILTILLAGILVSGMCSKTGLAGLELEMLLPEHIFARQSTPAQLRLKNIKRHFPSYSLTVSSRLQEKKRLSRSGPAATSLHPVLAEPIYAPYVPAGGTEVHQRVRLNFPRRGRYGQDEFLISSKFPFGILRRTRALALRCEVLALPNIQPSEAMANQFDRLAAEIQGRRKGRGDDLYSLRDYHDGDSARHVNWKATAKSQRLKVREFTDQEESRLTFIFDNRTPDLNEQTLERFERGVSLCACLAWSSFEAGCFLQFLSADFKTPMAPASEIIYHLLEALAIAQPNARPNATLFQGLGGLIEGFPVVFATARQNLESGAIPEGADVICPDP